MSDRKASRLHRYLWTAVCLGLLLPWGAHAVSPGVAGLAGAAFPATPAVCAGADVAAILAAPTPADAPLVREPARQPAATCPPLFCRSVYSSCLSQCNVNPHTGCTADCFHQYQACSRGTC
jgi:hypothetical protein